MFYNICYMLYLSIYIYISIYLCIYIHDYMIIHGDITNNYLDVKHLEWNTQHLEVISNMWTML